MGETQIIKGDREYPGKKKDGPPWERHQEMEGE